MPKKEGYLELIKPENDPIRRREAKVQFRQAVEFYRSRINDFQNDASLAMRALESLRSLPLMTDTRFADEVTRENMALLDQIFGEHNAVGFVLSSIKGNLAHPVKIDRVVLDVDKLPTFPSRVNEVLDAAQVFDQTTQTTILNYIFLNLERYIARFNRVNTVRPQDSFYPLFRWISQNYQSMCQRIPVQTVNSVLTARYGKLVLNP
ncbi:MAG: hypothetical protein WC775_05805 [Patescibacteria group bacterium]|jgi:hypothetical protein